MVMKENTRVMAVTRKAGMLVNTSLTSVEVEAEKIFGPDLMKGERDEPDTGEAEDSDGQSSKVQIVSPPAKRSRTE